MESAISAAASPTMAEICTIASCLLRTGRCLKVAQHGLDANERHDGDILRFAHGSPEGGERLDPGKMAAQNSPIALAAASSSRALTPCR